MRGQLTPQIQKIAFKKLGRKISIRELRLMPYIQYVMVNDQKLDPNKINSDERAVLADWRKQGWVDGGMLGLTVSKKFWNAIHEIIWLGYVDISE